MTKANDILNLISEESEIDEKKLVKRKMIRKQPKIAKPKVRKQHEARDVNIGDDILDTRDLQQKMDELQGELDGLESEQDIAEFNDDKDRGVLLNQLKEAESEVPEWSHGEVLIKDSYFTDYQKEQLSDLGYIPDDFPWWIVIDYEATAENMKTDYSSITLGDDEYWYRSA